MQQRKKRERIIICATCGKEVVTASNNRKRCPECAEQKRKMDQHKAWKAKKVMQGENPENALIWFCDSPENIKKCLNCKRPDCHNCLDYKT